MLALGIRIIDYSTNSSRNIAASSRVGEYSEGERITSNRLSRVLFATEPLLTQQLLIVWTVVSGVGLAGPLLLYSLFLMGWRASSSTGHVAEMVPPDGAAHQRGWRVHGVAGRPTAPPCCAPSSDGMALHCLSVSAGRD